MVARPRFRTWPAVLALVLSLAPPASAFALPPSSDNVDLVGSVRMHDAAEGHIRNLTTLGDYAYLGAYELPFPPCSLPGGVYVVDISDPSSPKEVGFLPTAPLSLVYDGLQALRIDTPAFAGDVLVHTNEACSSTSPTARGGVSLWNVTDPRNPQPLALGAGDMDPLPGVPPRAHRARQMTAWDAGDRAFLAMVDAEESGNDIDIMEITDPRNPRRIAETGLASWPGAQNAQAAGIGAAPNTIAFDMAVRNVGGNWLGVFAANDAGYALLNLNDPANPVFLEDSDYPDPDTLTGVGPEGNAGYVDWDRTGRLILAADFDEIPYRPQVAITSGAFTGERFSATPGTGAAPVRPQSPVNGPSYYVGLACTALPPAPSPDAIAVVERGTCTFQVKFDRTRAAGYTATVLFNSTVAGNGCESSARIGMVGDRPYVMVARSAGYKILAVPGYDPARCRTGPNPPLPPAGTRASDLSLTSQFDGWGYVRLLDAATLAERDAYAPREALDVRYAEGFGALTVSEVAADPTHDLAYATWRDAGFRVLEFTGGDLREVGHFTDDASGNFWGVGVHVKDDGRRYVLAAEADTGLSVFRYGTDLGVTTRARTSHGRSVLTWTTRVGNAGTIAATGVSLRIALPRRLETTSVRASRGRCARVGRALDCRLGTLAEDALAQVRVVSRARRSGRVSSISTVTSPEVDYDPRNNRAEASARVARPRVRLAGAVALSGRRP